MPTLTQSLAGQDLGHLRILADHWGLELLAPDARQGLLVLAKGILQPELVQEVVETLPVQAQQALQALRASAGRLTWKRFVRRYGEVREMGSGRRDRERPDRAPVSVTEVLWYRGLIGRAFFETPNGPQEFAYIPDDLLALLPASQLEETVTAEKPAAGLQWGRAATPAERAHPQPADDRLLDHLCTLLAAQRTGLAPVPIPPALQFFAPALLVTADLNSSSGQPQLETLRAHLEADRATALAQLAQAWFTSPDHNDLHHVPGLQPEGDWRNDPLQARHFVLSLLRGLPANTWWSLSATIADIQQRNPDFQRPAGDYDSWFIKDVANGEFLRGYQHWLQVDGALIRYLISGPLHWLGLLDLAWADEEQTLVTAFRRSRWAAALLQGRPPAKLPLEDGQLHVRSDGRVHVPLNVSRAVRYQVARFCQWEPVTAHEYRYRLTPASLQRAMEQGLQVSHLLSLLARHAGQIPPNVLAALKRWDERGTEVRLQQAEVLRVGSPQILQALRSSRAARFLGDPLGPTSVIVKPGAGSKVLAALTEMGYFGSDEISET
ncbi:MAG: helicase-associated domain-containing protein [Anaerolineales bacterium]|nr:helicase-associated domain-containing protein [Anaerolineales bacterium]